MKSVYNLVMFNERAISQKNYEQEVICNEKESGCNAFSRHYGGWRSGRLRRFF